MNSELKEILWKQFGAAIDMFENSLDSCPEKLWDTESKFWYIAYHTLFFLDYYLSEDPDNFLPPEPFSLSEFSSEGDMPERVYTKEELITYTKFCREKCRNLISGLDENNEKRRFINKYRNYSVTEILIYNMRHVQHHAAQLNLLLRQHSDFVPDWVSRTKVNL